MQKAVGHLATGPCWIMTACLTLVVCACQSTRPQPDRRSEQRSARLEAKVERLSDEPALSALSADPGTEVPNPPRPTAPAAPPAPPAMADHALLKAAGAPRAASLTQVEAHGFIRLKSSIERANAAARKKKHLSP